MTLEVTVRRRQAARLNECLAKGKPIKGIRTTDDLIALAGACYFRLLLRQPTLDRNREWSLAALRKQEEAVFLRQRELVAAIEHTAHTHFQLNDGGSTASVDPVFRLRVAFQRERIKYVNLKPNRKSRR